MDLTLDRKIDENPEETDSQDEEPLADKIPSAPVENIPTVGPPRSPLPPDSPLLRSRTASPALQRARWRTRNEEKLALTGIDICRNFNKELRRQASFKAARERQSASRTNSPACSRYSKSQDHHHLLYFNLNLNAPTG